MLAEVISFGGLVKDFKSILRSRRQQIQKGEKDVHVISDDGNKLSVIVRKASRDPKTGKMIYEVFDSFDVGGASPEQVFATVKEAVLRAGAARPALAK